jgi:hypothetical protein
MGRTLWPAYNAEVRFTVALSRKLTVFHGYRKKAVSLDSFPKVLIIA